MKDEFHMEEPEEEDESLSLCNLSINLLKDDNPYFSLEIKPKVDKTLVATADDKFDFGSLGGFCNYRRSAGMFFSLSLPLPHTSINHLSFSKSTEF